VLPKKPPWLLVCVVACFTWNSPSWKLKRQAASGRNRRCVLRAPVRLWKSHLSASVACPRRPVANHRSNFLHCADEVYGNIRAIRAFHRSGGGRHDDPNETGEVSHFQALNALSATVGSWQHCCGDQPARWSGRSILMTPDRVLFGMSSKFPPSVPRPDVRDCRPNGQGFRRSHVLSLTGPDIGLRPLGKVLAGVFAVFLHRWGYYGGNMFQANQSFAGIATAVPAFQNLSWFMASSLAYVWWLMS